MPATPVAPAKSPAKECCGIGDHLHHHCCGGAKKILLVLAGIFLVYIIFYVGALSRNELKKFVYIGKADRTERTISVNGYGKIVGTNDIAVTSIGYSNTDKDVAKAQLDNKAVMDQVMNGLKTIGIVDKDMQSDYSIYPDFSYNDKRVQELKGYKVTNQITVKIRDLTKIPDVLGLAGKFGTTEVGGLSFTIDSKENLKERARIKSLVDAKAKAQKLAQFLGVKLGSVISYNEYEGNSGYYGANNLDFKMADSGGMEASTAPAAIAGGSQDIEISNTIIYEILP
jgi:uncharacterized protein